MTVGVVVCGKDCGGPSLAGEGGVEIPWVVFWLRELDGNSLNETTDEGEAAGTSRVPFAIAMNGSCLGREMAAAEAFKAITHCREITDISPVNRTIWGGVSDTSQTFLETDVKGSRLGLGTIGTGVGQGTTRAGPLASLAHLAVISRSGGKVSGTSG
jgi:hypothetical protein